MADQENKSQKKRSGKTLETAKMSRTAKKSQTAKIANGTRKSKKSEKNSRTVRYPRTNRQYKDTVFRMLFSEERNLLSLYNALNQTAYTDPDMLQIVTLKNALYMGIKNDLAFILQQNLFLYEHQSTLNPNMPLRDLFYISGEYEKLINRKSLYSSVLQEIPTPRFVVLYNGTSAMGDSTEYRLSDAYKNPSKDPDLELRVQVLNINEGHNTELMEKCRTLKEYAQFVACVRRHVQEENGDLDTAMEKAVEECIEKNILREFLEENKAEVIRMSIFEYNAEKEMKKLRRTEYEGGRQAGMRDGMRAGLTKGRAEGREEGQVLTVLKLAGKHSWSHEEMVQNVSEVLGVDNQKAERLLMVYKA